jgi:NAD(P)-dependent dehydrogenase (short-subunit alcohol dehydrogenase family)
MMSNVISVGRAGKLEEIASALLWLSSPSASFVAGQVITVDGGFTAHYASKADAEEQRPVSASRASTG